MVGMTEFDVCKLRDYAADLAQQAASLISTKAGVVTCGAGRQCEGGEHRGHRGSGAAESARHGKTP